MRLSGTIEGRGIIRPKKILFLVLPLCMALSSLADRRKAVLHLGDSIRMGYAHHLRHVKESFHDVRIVFFLGFAGEQIAKKMKKALALEGVI